MKHILTGALAAFCLSGAAQAAVLDFNPSVASGTCEDSTDTIVVCGNGSSIRQAYGDIAGQLDVIYDNDAALPGTLSQQRLQWWNQQYSNLTGIAYGSGNQNSGPAEIFLKPATGFEVLITSFQLGGYPNSDRSTQWTVRDGNSAVLASSGPITVLGNVATTVVLNLVSTTGFKIQWGPEQFNVGIDNITFTVRAIDPNVVPIPGALALMIPGLLGLRFAARKRKAA